MLEKSIDKYNRNELVHVLLHGEYSDNPEKYEHNKVLFRYVQKFLIQTKRLVYKSRLQYIPWIQYHCNILNGIFFVPLLYNLLLHKSISSHITTSSNYQLVKLATIPSLFSPFIHFLNSPLHASTCKSKSHKSIYDQATGPDMPICAFSRSLCFIFMLPFEYFLRPGNNYILSLSFSEIYSVRCIVDI